MVTGASTAPVTQETSATAVASPQRTRSENRRSNKPIMEKRRRARINNCLNELKSLILDAMKKDPARHSKLEKADILEMTVKHLEAMQRQQIALAAATDPKVLNKFRAGFTECAGEVGRFPGLEPPVKRRLLQHLATCLNNHQTTGPSSPSREKDKEEFEESATAGKLAQREQEPQRQHQQSAGVQVTLVAGAGAATQVAPAAGILLSAGCGNLQLVPTRLPNGDIALVLPSVGRQQPSPPPLTTPLTLVRTPPTPPPSTTSSYPSPPSTASPRPPLSPPSPPPLPLSLVVRKTPTPPASLPSSPSPLHHNKEVVLEEKPWRPW